MLFNLYEQSSCILLTGAMGFLGKVVLEELLRRRTEYELEKVIIIARAKRGQDPLLRFCKDVVASPCFSALPTGWITSVQVVEGDLAYPNCGLSAAAYDSICKQVTHIIHCAGSISVDLPLAEAAAANIAGPLNLCALARKCHMLQRMVTTSTAYVTPHTRDPIYEMLSPLPLPASRLYEGIQTGSFCDTDLLRATGHPNTCTLSKCIGEHLLMEKRGGVPITIVRPSIISASRHFPFPGWIDSQATFAAFVAAAGAGLLHVIDGDKKVLLDIVPVDEVAQRLIDECLLEGRPPTESPIVFAVAGLQHAAELGPTASTIANFFTRNRPIRIGVRRAEFNYIGPRNFKFHLHDSLRQQMPMRLAMFYFGLRGNTVVQQETKRLIRVVKTINREFPYFTHHTFDFRPSVPLPADFEIEEFIEVASAGVHRYLLQRSR